MMYPGKIENMNVLIDINNVGLFDLPNGLLSDIINTLAILLPSRLATVFLMNPGGLISTSVALLEKIMNPNVFRSIKLIPAKQI